MFGVSGKVALEVGVDFVIIPTGHDDQPGGPSVEGDSGAGPVFCLYRFGGVDLLGGDGVAANEYGDAGCFVELTGEVKKVGLGNRFEVDARFGYPSHGFYEYADAVNAVAVAFYGVVAFEGSQ